MPQRLEMQIFFLCKVETNDYKCKNVCIAKKVLVKEHSSIYTIFICISDLTVVIGLTVDNCEKAGLNSSIYVYV